MGFNPTSIGVGFNPAAATTAPNWDPVGKNFGFNPTLIGVGFNPTLNSGNERGI